MVTGSGVLPTALLGGVIVVCENFPHGGWWLEVGIIIITIAVVIFRVIFYLSELIEAEEAEVEKGVTIPL